MHYQRLSRFTLLSLTLLSPFGSNPIQAAPDALFKTSSWELCGGPGSGHQHELEPVGDPDDLTTYIDADVTDVVRKEEFIFQGGVSVRRGDQQIEAEDLVYNKPKDTIEARGNLRYRENDLLVQGKSGSLELDSRKGSIEEAQYQIPSQHAHGSAERVTLAGRDLAYLKRARYTTCNPGDEDWYLESSNVKLNFDEAVGSGRNVVVRFKGVPIFYSPYISFPLNDERKSGFLTPGVGSSSDTGFEVRVPYYWNIAPNRDATLTSRLMSKRNLQLIGEFRYLNATNSGDVNVGYLPNDPEFDGDRLFLSVRHRASFGPRLSGLIDYNYVSDDQYFEDLGTSLRIASTQFLDRRAEATYRGDFWSATARVQGFQTVDDTVFLGNDLKPYERLPQFLLNANVPDQFLGSSYLFSGEFVNFHRNDDVSGLRTDIAPGISLPLTKPSGFVTPALSVRNTQYSLTDEPAGRDFDDSRTLPIFSVDSGVFFERPTSLFSKKMLQTLEPRLFYLYVPHEDQDDFPVFDTNLIDFTFPRLFQTNRFNGADRQGDANQVTLALTSRLLDRDTGTERLNFKFGQLYYFRDREVTLPGGIVGTDSSSDFITEVDSAQLIKNWRGNFSLNVDPQDTRVDRASLGLRYQPDEDRFVHLGYRFRRTDVDDEENALNVFRPELLHQSDIAALWPIYRTSTWQLNGVTRWNYSFESQRTLEVLGGIEYDTCCFAFRIAGRRFVNGLEDRFNTRDTSNDTNTGVFLQLELKGLTNFGSKGKRGLAGLLDTRPGDRNFSGLGYQGGR